LIQQAAPGVQIVITMSGHGTQLPIPDDQSSALDPRNRELDGLDEAFLPADARPGEIKAILDDQFAEWLGQLKQRGARVWIVFDCCHSGTLTRGIEGGERSRGISGRELGITEASWARARQKADEAREQSRRAGSERVMAAESDFVGPTVEGGSTAGARAGSVTAFFAAQAYETTPDALHPADGPDTPENYFGLLSYILVQTLDQCPGRLTYRDLGRHIAARYRAVRGSRGPTPMFVGDLDRYVLGVQQSASMPIYLECAGGQTRLSAGSLANVTAGSVYSVHPPAGGTADETELLGYVRVTRVTPTHAEVASVAYGALARATDLDALPHLARCRVAVRDLGDLRVAIAVREPRESREAPHCRMLRDALRGLPREAAELVHFVDGVHAADWTLRPVTPEEAKAEFDLRLSGPHVLLLTGGARGSVTRERHGGTAVSARRPPMGWRVRARYALTDGDALVTALARDLRRIYTWQNLWRVAGTLSRHSPQLRLAAVLADDGSGGQSDLALPDGLALRAGQRFEVRLANDTNQDMWVTVMYLDANLGIQIWASESVERRRALEPLLIEVDETSLGSEGIVVLAAPMKQVQDRPDFAFLAQEPLGAPGRDLVLTRTVAGTPFGQLLAALKAGSSVRTRSHAVHAPTDPYILTWTWRSVPPGTDLPE